MKAKEYNSLIELTAEAYRMSLKKATGIDEISLLFGGRNAFDEFVTAAKEEHETHFASSREAQVLQGKHDFPLKPVSIRYRTTYEFIWPHPYNGYRIEAMHIDDATPSFMHQALFDSEKPFSGQVVVAHASFKCKTNADYWNAKTALNRSNVRRFVAEYKNNYGVFSYFESEGLPFFLKPRINTRDMKKI